MTRAAALLLAVVLAATGCASVKSPRPGVAEWLQAAQTFSGLLHVSLRGPGVRGGTAVLVGYRRPGSLRLEVPGPTGARLIAVAHDQRLTAVFPAERAVYRGPASAEGLDALLGIALSPAEVISVLTGTGSPRLERYEVSWGPQLPSRIRADLPDGIRLTVKIQEGEAGPPLPPEAFEEPRHAGYREVDAEEARRLWTGR